jgi:hypothetical protein
VTPKIEPSPEVKAMIREWVRLNEAKYGPDWKKKLAEEMTAKSMPAINALLALQKAAKK